MNPPREERRHSHGRRSDDELSTDILLGYERWAGHFWRHRGKIAAAIGLLGSALGCVAGYLGRAHDLDQVKAQLSVNTADIRTLEQRQTEHEIDVRVNRQMLCSLTRRLDPAGLPEECTAAPTTPTPRRP